MIFLILYQYVRLGDDTRERLLDIRHPNEFQGSIDFSLNSVIDLDGLVADAWAYSGNGPGHPNGTLYLYSGPNHQTVDVIPFTDTNTAFGIAQGTSTGGKGVEIFASGYPNIPHSSDLLLHL